MLDGLGFGFVGHIAKSLDGHLTRWVEFRVRHYIYDPLRVW